MTFRQWVWYHVLHTTHSRVQGLVKSLVWSRTASPVLEQIQDRVWDPILDRTLEEINR
jgi:hypothetical protein